MAAMRPIEALCEDGLLKPKTPLSLRPGEEVGVILIRHPDPRRWNLQRLAGGRNDDLLLAEQGLAEWRDTLAAEDHH
jgi:predicted DNA-binding antitoxin AbrB/MazE fold protein